MRIHITASDGVPIYLQIVHQVRRLVAAGELVAGEEMLSIRVLAEKLVVNPNTVARAYRELELLGVVTFSRGLGTFVAASDLQTLSSERQSLLAEKIDGLISESRHMGVSFEELLDLIRVRQSCFRSAEESALEESEVPGGR